MCPHWHCTIQDKEVVGTALALMYLRMHAPFMRLPNLHVVASGAETWFRSAVAPVDRASLGLFCAAVSQAWAEDQRLGKGPAQLPSQVLFYTGAEGGGGGGSWGARPRTCPRLSGRNQVRERDEASRDREGQ